MSLLDEARHATKRPGSQQSRIMRLVDMLDGDERAEVVALIWDGDPNVSARAIGEVLTKHFADLVGEVTGNQVEDHRRNKARPE
jgi:hypothetical protein